MIVVLEAVIIFYLFLIESMYAPKYTAKCYITEKVDVYTFGMLLLPLLKGQPSDFHVIYQIGCIPISNKIR